MATPLMVKSMTEMSGIDEKGTKKDAFFNGFMINMPLNQ